MIARIFTATLNTPSDSVSGHIEWSGGSGWIDVGGTLNATLIMDVVVVQPSVLDAQLLTAGFIPNVTAVGIYPFSAPQGRIDFTITLNPGESCNCTVSVFK